MKRAFGVDVASSARVDAIEEELDRFVTKRHDRRVAEEGRRPSEVMYAESCRRHSAMVEQERRQEWIA